jgi:hypothetical protein
MEYATHRLLWSWYSRDRDSQSSSKAWDRSPDPDTEIQRDFDREDEMDSERD